MEKLGDKIRELRKLRQITVRELADRCNVTPGFISLIENNKRIPNDDKIEKIAKVLQTDLSEYFHETPSDSRWINKTYRPDIVFERESFKVFIELKTKVNPDIVANMTETPLSINLTYSLNKAVEIALVELLHEYEEELHKRIDVTLRKYQTELDEKKQVYGKLLKSDSD